MIGIIIALMLFVIGVSILKPLVDWYIKASGVDTHYDAWYQEILDNPSYQVKSKYENDAFQK